MLLAGCITAMSVMRAAPRTPIRNGAFVMV
jgi:hypothetical protein